MARTAEQNTREILNDCRELGFAAAGVCPIGPTRWREHLLAWLRDGKHGTMEYLEKYAEFLVDPSPLLKGAKWALVVADQYALRGDEVVEQDSSRLAGRVARYARGLDYHRVIKKRLHALCDALRPKFPGEEFRSFTDTLPVMEREFAQRAGLGWIGKHTLLINPKRGSYLLIGGVLTTMEFEVPADQRDVSDACGTCTRCIDACPTKAITPYSVDASRCISYLTIERRETIDPSFYAAMGDWVYGCDVCQEVCPHNSAREEGVDVGAAREEYAAHVQEVDLLDVLGWTMESRRVALKGTSMKRATLEMMKRNALIALGNALRENRDEAVVARVRVVAADESEDADVRLTARTVLARLGLPDR